MTTRTPELECWAADQLVFFCLPRTLWESCCSPCVIPAHDIVMITPENGKRDRQRPRTQTRDLHISRFERCISGACTSSRLPAKFSLVQCSVQGFRQLRRCCQGHGQHLPDILQMKRVSSHPSPRTSKSFCFRCQLLPARCQRRCALQAHLGAQSGAQTTQFRRVPRQTESGILEGILRKFSDKKPIVPTLQVCLGGVDHPLEV